MSAFVLNQEEINLLTQATAAMLSLNKRAPKHYTLSKETLDLIGKYSDDLHNIYRALFITNIKAVNSRYGENEKTLPKYTPLQPWVTDTCGRFNLAKMKKAAGMFGCYIYQCSEDLVFGSPAFNAFHDIYKLLCFALVKWSIDWDGESSHF